MGSISQLAQVINLKLRQDDDLTICIDGREGRGKSTLALLLGLAIDSNFHLERNVLYSPSEEELKEKMTKSPKYSAIIADEAIKVLYKQNWSKQTFVAMLFAVIRQENKCAILVLPRFTDLNEYFRNHRVYIYIHVIERGRAVVFAYDDTVGVKQPWHLDENYAKIKSKLNGKLPNFVDPQVYESALQSCDNFLMMLDFPPMPLEMETMYKELKGKYKLDGLDRNEGNPRTAASVKRENKWKFALLKAVAWLTQENYNVEDICKNIGIERSSVVLAKKEFADGEQDVLTFNKIYKSKAKHPENIEEKMDILINNIN